jgi:hypothetical protein
MQESYKQMKKVVERFKITPPIRNYPLLRYQVIFVLCIKAQPPKASENNDVCVVLRFKCACFFFKLVMLSSFIIITEDNKKERISFTFFIGLKNKITR